MKKQIVAVLAAVFFAAVCVPAIFSADEKAVQKEDVASVIKTKCVGCHDTDETNQHPPFTQCRLSGIGCNYNTYSWCHRRSQAYEPSGCFENG